LIGLRHVNVDVAALDGQPCKIIGVSAMRRYDRLKPPARDRFKEAHKDAIAKAHARRFSQVSQLENSRFVPANLCAACA
jgi:hypothetical protein